MALKLSDMNEADYKLDASSTQSSDSKSMLSSVLNFGKGVLTGGAKSFGEFTLGAGQLGRGIQQNVVDPALNAVGIQPVQGDSVFDQENADYIRENTLKATAPGEGTGKFIGTAAQYLTPSRAITLGQAGLKAVPRMTGAGNIATKAIQGTTNTVMDAASRFIPESVGTGAVSYLRSGGDLEEAKSEGALAGAFSIAFGKLGDLARKTYFPELQQSVAKTLGLQGSISGGNVLKDLDKKITGFRVLSDYAPDVMVKNADGLEVPFDPSKATYETTIQAWNQTKNKIYNQYTDLATKAGSKAKINLTGVIDELSDTLNQPGLSQYKQAAERLLKDMQESFPDPTKVDLLTGQKFMEDLNNLVTKSAFSGVSDTAVSRVNIGAAKAIREQIDYAIENAGLTDESYAALRGQYSALKTLEDDLVRRFQQEARKMGGGLSDYVDLFSSGEIIAGMFSGNPTLIAQGATRSALTALRRVFVNPERHLRRTFDLIQREGNDTWDVIKNRLFGGTRELNQAEQGVVDYTKNALSDVQGGMSIKATASEASLLGYIKQQEKRLDKLRRDGMSVNNPTYRRIEDSISQAQRQYEKLSPSR